MIWIIVIGFMLLSWIASSRLKRKFTKYSQVQLGSGLSGAEIAQLMLRDNGINDVDVISVEGHLTDHYNPVNKTVNLSPDVYHGRSAASAAVAAHECGHAVQHATAYSMLQFRSAMVPIQNVSGQIMNTIIMISIFGGAFLFSMGINNILLILIACQTVITLFSLVTLPVEYDASKRALAWVQERNIVNSDEHAMAKDALNAAASTYLISALGSITMLLYYVLSFLGND